MKNGILFILITISISTAAFSQSSDSSYLPENKFGLMFQIGDNFNFTSFEGSALSFKYILNNNSALRFSLSPYFSNSNANQDYFINDSSTGYNEISSVKNEIELSLVYLQYLRSYDNMYFYLGGGPLVRFDNAKQELFRPETDMKTIDETTRNSYGLKIVLGAEWFPAKNIGINAEYTIGLVYEKYENERSSITTGTTRSISESSSTTFRGDGAKIGICFYF